VARKEKLDPKEEVWLTYFEQNDGDLPGWRCKKHGYLLQDDEGNMGLCPSCARYAFHGAASIRDEDIEEAIYEIASGIYFGKDYCWEGSWDALKTLDPEWAHKFGDDHGELEKRFPDR
jgi:hypothetical protein